MSTWKTYKVEVFYKNDPVYVIELKSDSLEAACKRAKNTVWMMALKDGREFVMDDIKVGEYIDA